METECAFTMQHSLQTRTLDSSKAMQIARNGGNRVQICWESRKQLIVLMLQSFHAGLCAGGTQPGHWIVEKVLGERGRLIFPKMGGSKVDVMRIRACRKQKKRTSAATAAKQAKRLGGKTNANDGTCTPTFAHPPRVVADSGKGTSMYRLAYTHGDVISLMVQSKWKMFASGAHMNIWKCTQDF